MKTIIFLLFAAISWSYGDNNPLDYACPHAWSQRNGYCYRYFDETLSWSIAESTCLEHFDTDGVGHLASIHDQAENDFIFEVFRLGYGDIDMGNDKNRTESKSRNGIWIGLYQETRAGPWVWSDGTHKDFTHWLPGQPDNGYHARARFDEDCVGIWRVGDHGSDSTRQWDDIECDVQGGMPFVCKMPAVTQVNDAGIREQLQQPHVL